MLKKIILLIIFLLFVFLIRDLKIVTGKKKNLQVKSKKSSDILKLDNLKKEEIIQLPVKQTIKKSEYKLLFSVINRVLENQYGVNYFKEKDIVYKSKLKKQEEELIVKFPKNLKINKSNYDSIYNYFKKEYQKLEKETHSIDFILNRYQQRIKPISSKREIAKQLNNYSLEKPVKNVKCNDKALTKVTSIKTIKKETHKDFDSKFPLKPLLLSIPFIVIETFRKQDNKSVDSEQKNHFKPQQSPVTIEEEQPIKQKNPINSPKAEKQLVSIPITDKLKIVNEVDDREKINNKDNGEHQQKISSVSNDEVKKQSLPSNERDKEKKDNNKPKDNNSKVKKEVVEIVVVTNMLQEMVKQSTLKPEVEDKEYDTLLEKINLELLKIDEFLILNEGKMTSDYLKIVYAQREKLYNLKKNVSKSRQEDISNTEAELKEIIDEDNKELYRAKRNEINTQYQQDQLKIQKSSKDIKESMRKDMIIKRLKKADTAIRLSNLSIFRNRFFRFLVSGLFINRYLKEIKAFLGVPVDLDNDFLIDSINTGSDALNNSIFINNQNLFELESITKTVPSIMPSLRQRLEYNVYMKSLKKGLIKREKRLNKKQKFITERCFNKGLILRKKNEHWTV